MEQSRRTRLGLIGLGALVLASGLGFIALGGGRERIAGHAYPIPSPDNRILVEVLNGTARHGLARQGARRLRRQGLDVIFFGNAEQPSDSTQVIARRGSTDAAERVREALGTGTVSIEPDTLRRVDVTVILGDDFNEDPEVHP